MKLAWKEGFLAIAETSAVISPLMQRRVEAVMATAEAAVVPGSSEEVAMVADVETTMVVAEAIMAGVDIIPKTTMVEEVTIPRAVSMGSTSNAKVGEDVAKVGELLV